jgi:hypothetical protein
MLGIHANNLNLWCTGIMYKLPSLDDGTGESANSSYAITLQLHLQSLDCFSRRNSQPLPGYG